VGVEGRSGKEGKWVLVPVVGEGCRRMERGGRRDGNWEVKRKEIGMEKKKVR
jgi:hypothetical protein